MSLARHRTEALVRRRAATVVPAVQARRRRPRGPLDPSDAAAIATALTELRARLARGESRSSVQTELLERLWTWVESVVERTVRRLPAHADSGEVRSQIAGAVWHCCGRFDVDDAERWVAGLRTRVRGAVIDAARRDDPLSRRDRRAVSEQRATAAVTAAGRGALELRDAHVLEDLSVDIDRRLVDDDIRASVRDWICNDLPPDLGQQLLAWWRRTNGRSPLPPTLAMRLEPFLFRLDDVLELIGG